MEQWVTLLTITNASTPSPPSVALTSKLNRMEQQIVNLLRQRSRTPAPGRGSRNQPKAAQQPQPASRAPQQQKKGKGKGAKGSGKKGKGNGKATPQSSPGRFRSFSEIRQFGGSLPRERSISKKRMACVETSSHTCFAHSHHALGITPASAAGRPTSHTTIVTVSTTSSERPTPLAGAAIQTQLQVPLVPAPSPSTPVSAACLPAVAAIPDIVPPAPFTVEAAPVTPGGNLLSNSTHVFPPVAFY